MSEWIEKEEALKQIDCWLTTGEYKYSNATHYLNKRISSIKPKSEWISVNDRLPETKYGTNVLAINDIGDIFIGKLIDESTIRMTDGFLAHHVTHWMPLPEPPKSENDVE